MVLASLFLAHSLLLQVPQTASPAVVQTPVVATPPATEAPAAPTPVPAAAEEMVCRNEIATGRRVPRRVCRSRAQMQAEAAAGQEALRRAQENHRRSNSN